VGENLDDDAVTALLAGNPRALLLCRRALAGFSRDDDAMIVDWANRWMMDTKSTSPPQASDFSLRTREEELRYQALASRPLAAVRQRLALLLHFNALLEQCINFVDMSAGSLSPASETTLAGDGAGVASSCSMGGKLRLLAHCVLMSVKTPVLAAALEATVSTGRRLPPIRLDNNKATHSEMKGEVEPGESRCVVLRAPSACVGVTRSRVACLTTPTLLFCDKKFTLHRVAGASSRKHSRRSMERTPRASGTWWRATSASRCDCDPCSPSLRVCRRVVTSRCTSAGAVQVSFADESGIDAGGVYREALARMVDDDLQSPKLTLLIPCPNMR
jgi:hypothetical protein